jgi:hypothetical protein
MSRIPAPDRFETVAYVYSQSDLALLLSLFEHADIYLQQIGSRHASVEWALTIALGGIALRVHEEDGDDARALLAGLEYPPYRAPFFTGLWPIYLAFLALAVFALGVAPPPRQIPTYILGETVRREP